MDRYSNVVQEDDEAVVEGNGNNNESLDAVNISTPGTYSINHQGRPQTSHGRVRKNFVPVNGIQRREEKQSGLGETSVQNWDESKETDLSKQQIIRERKLANQQQPNTMKPKKAYTGAAFGGTNDNEFDDSPADNKTKAYKRNRQDQKKRNDNVAKEIVNDFDELEDIMGTSPKTKKKSSNMEFLDDDDDLFGTGGGFGQNKADNYKKS